MADDGDAVDRGDAESQKSDKMFTLKKWNAVAMWSWDVECDTCAICRVQVMGKCYIFISCTWISGLWFLCAWLMF
jgi:RING-box protein 2